MSIRFDRLTREDQVRDLIRLTLEAFYPDYLNWEEMFSSFLIRRFEFSSKQGELGFPFTGLFGIPYWTQVSAYEGILSNYCHAKNFKSSLIKKNSRVMLRNIALGKYVPKHPEGCELDNYAACHLGVSLCVMFANIMRSYNPDNYCLRHFRDMFPVWDCILNNGTAAVLIFRDKIRMFENEIGDPVVSLDEIKNDLPTNARALLRYTYHDFNWSLLYGK